MAFLFSFQAAPQCVSQYSFQHPLSPGVPEVCKRGRRVLPHSIHTTTRLQQDIVSVSCKRDHSPSIITANCALPSRTHSRMVRCRLS